MRLAAAFIIWLVAFWCGWAVRASDPKPWNEITIPMTGTFGLIIIMVVLVAASHEKD